MSKPRGFLWQALELGFLAAIYVAVAWVGLQIGAVGRFATLVWPPAGLALGALVLGGPRLWPGIAVGAFAINAWTGAPAWVACGIALGNTAEALVGAWALEGFASKKPTLGRMRDVVALVLPSAGLSTTLSASIGVASLALGGLVPLDRAAETWQVWWLGDVVGDLVVAPLLLAWAAKHGSLASERLAEAALVLVLLVGSSLFAFGLILPDAPAELRRQRPFQALPALIWAAVRFGPRGAATGNFVVTAVAVLGTVVNPEPDVNDPLSLRLLYLQPFTALFAITGLVLGATTAERRQIERQQRLLLATSARLLESLEPPRILGDVARAVVPALADACTLDLLQGDGSLRRVAAASHPNGDARVEVYEDGRARAPSDSERRALQTGRAMLHVSPEATRWEHSLGEVELHDYTADPATVWRVEIPLTAAERVLGLLSLETTDRERPNTAAERRVAIELARLAAVAIVNARLYRDAQYAIRARDEFLSIASHELRTPLSVLVLQLEKLSRTVAAGGLSACTPGVAAAARQTERLTRLVDGLLDVSRIVTGQLTLSRERFDFADTVRDVTETFSDEAARQGTPLELRAPPGATGSWDRLRLEQVVTNLLSNAIKYGAGKPVALSVEATPDVVRLTVSDHGIGISAADVDRIFGRFERAVSARHYGGLGLGLFIARQIVEAHGGHIRVDTEYGAGSTFTVDLPR